VREVELVVVLHLNWQSVAALWCVQTLILDAAKETVALIEQLGSKAFAVQCDVAKEEQVNQLAEQAEQLMQHPNTCD
jgi:NAD(P)-dependent dehydrogenase (short-subunit alcohol dehydrogenase family)